MPVQKLMMTMFSATNRRPSGHLSRLYLAIILMMEVLNKGSWAAFVPNCLSEETASYCQCNEDTSRSGSTVSITCDFANKEDVVLTDALYSFNRGYMMQTYVQVANATSVTVTESFLRNIQHCPSIALDFWRSGVLIFDSTPQAEQQRFLPSYTTYMGIGIINCTVPSIPKKLLRDRVVGGLLIKRSRIGTISQGSLFNIIKMRYLVIEDSSVDQVESGVANRDFLSLEPGTSDIWHGFKILNSTIGTIASTAFNFVYKPSSAASRTCEAKMVNNRLGDVGTEAISIRGKLDVTIQGNTFLRLQEDALKVNVTGDLKFEENVVELLEPGGLKSLLCGNSTSMEKNTVHLKSPHETPFNTSDIPFEASCGNPQVFIVMSPAQPRMMSETSKATWVILTLLILVISVLVFGGIYTWRNQTFHRQYRRGVVPLNMGIRERATLNELHNSAELDVVENGTPDTGVSNPVYDIKEPS